MGLAIDFAPGEVNKSENVGDVTFNWGEDSRAAAAAAYSLFGSRLVRRQSALDYFIDSFNLIVAISAKANMLPLSILVAFAQHN